MSYEALKSKYQRDINRILDADRLTRKKGLQKLLEELPWNIPEQFVSLDLLFSHDLLVHLFSIIADPVEKCREISIQILLKYIEICNDVSPFASNLISVISQRIGDNPFPEPAEELRLQSAIALENLLKKIYTQNCIQQEVFPYSNLLQALPKALTDSFPAAKKQLADVIVIICQFPNFTNKVNSKNIVKALSSNCLHQHSKVRIASIKALSMTIACDCYNNDYENLIKEIILPLINKLIADNSASTRKELSSFIGHLLNVRVIKAHMIPNCPDRKLIPVDLQMLAYLILLIGEETPEVTSEAENNLKVLSGSWFKYIEQMDRQESFDETVELHDSASSLNSAGSGYIIQFFFQDISEILLKGISDWTADSRLRYIKSLTSFLKLCNPTSLSILLDNLLFSLGPPLSDDESAIRKSTEKCCQYVGTVVYFEELVDSIIPKIQGKTPGGDTSGNRCLAIRLLTEIIKGVDPQKSPSDINRLLHLIAQSLSDPDIHTFREFDIREALVLLIRSFIDSFLSYIKDDKICLCNLSIALIFLQGKLANESNLVCEAAVSEAKKISNILKLNGENADGESLYANCFFGPILETLCPKDKVVAWQSNSHIKSAFEVLVSICPRKAWENHINILPIIYAQIQPEVKSAPDPVADYLAQRGEEVIPDNPEVNVRLSLLALLEGMLRNGSSDWHCGQYIGAASKDIARQAILPNLIWRVGRVEATIRKVTLAVCYALLKCGGTLPQSLFEVAGELVPLLCSHLDDNDLSSRHMACLCINMILERLKGAFSDQAVSELYPKLLKRLDDSHDLIRIAICSTLQSFFRCAPKCNYSSTLLDYSLDQLFVHLDDSDRFIQEAAYSVIISISEINKDLALKKAEKNRHNLRDVSLLDKLIGDIQGFQILN